MYRIDGIYNSGYAHAPALIVNPSGSYPLIYNSTTGILQQTPNDQKVDKASEVEFKSVKTATVKSLTGTDAALIDSAGSIFAQNGLWSEKGVQISDLSLKKTVGTASAYEIKAAGLNDKLAIYSTKGVSIGFANNNFLFEPANMLFQGPSFRLPSGASMWTSKIDSVTGQSAITIADNGTVTIPDLTLPSTGVFKQLVVNNLPNQSGQLFIDKPYNDNSFHIRTFSTDDSHSLDIYASSIRNRNGTGGLSMDDNSTTTFLAQVNNFTNGVYLNNSLNPTVNRLWYDPIGTPSDRSLNLSTTGPNLNLSTTSSKVQLSGEIIYFANKVGTAFTNTAAFSSAGANFLNSVSVQGNIVVSGSVNASEYKLNNSVLTFPNQALNTTSSPTFANINATVSVDAPAYTLNGAAVSFPNQALNIASTPTFAGLTTTPVLPSLKAPILTTSTDGASTNSNPNGNGADLDVYDLRIRSGRLFTTAATLQLGKKFSCDKQFNITGNNATSSGVTPFVSLRGAVDLQIGTTNYPTAIIVSNEARLVTMENLQLTGLSALKAPGGVEAEFFQGSNIYANKWVNNFINTVEQAVATTTGPNFTNGIRVNNIKRPDGTQTYIDMNGTRPSFPLGLDATLSATSNAPSVVTYDSTTKTLGYAPTVSNIKANIRYAQNVAISYLNSASGVINTIQTFYAFANNNPYYGYIPYMIEVQFGGLGYPPLIESASTLLSSGASQNIFFSFLAQTPAESTNFPSNWERRVMQRFPALGSYMITWNIGSFYDPRRVLLSINKNFPIQSSTPAGNDPSALAVVEHYVTTLENGAQITALVNITDLEDYVTYSCYNYDARTFLAGQARNTLQIVKVA